MGWSFVSRLRQEVNGQDPICFIIELARTVVPEPGFVGIYDPYKSVPALPDARRFRPLLSRGHC